MANQNNKSFVETVVDAQKQVVDTLAESTRKIANGNAMVNETIDKSSEWYKNWLETQKKTLNQTTDKTADMTNNIQDNMSKMTEFYQNWFNTQNNMAKQMWEASMNQFQNAASTNGTAANTNPMNMWNNWMNQMQTMNNNMTQTNNWMNMMNQWSKMFNLDGMKQTNGDFTGMFNQYYEMLNNNMAKWQENLKNGTAQDTWKSMLNSTESFTRFSEMMAPMWKSIQDKTFNTEVYKQFMNPAKYKELMDQFLGFVPEGTRTYMQNMTTMMQDGMKQMNETNMQQFQQMRGMMANMMPNVNPTEMFGNVMNGYNQYSTMMNDAFAPFTKMMPPTAQTKTMAEWQDIAHRTALYNIKNAELQYMMYTQGTKVMDKLAENIMGKIQSGEEINSIMALYQEWMNLSDKTFVSLFEGDEYSQLMAEVSSMQIKLKKDIELQMEKMFVGIPVATRSEMDEMYKTIYDLKKQVRQMEKMMEFETEEPKEEVKPAARRSTAKK